jgi:hypothetical protein
MKRLAPVLGLAILAGPATARDALGIYEGWGAFRDAAPLRCFAIAEPMRKRHASWRPFAAVSHWPRQRIRGQVHIRLSREKRAGAAVTLRIDARRFSMVAGGADAWAPDPATDAAIVAAIRSGRSMSISTVAVNGAGFVDTYFLKGAATAIDAAALGCARGR